MPISDRRCDTAYARTEYSPTADSTSATAAKIVVSDATMRCAPRLSARLVSSVVKNEIGWSLSTLATTVRSTDCSAAASPSVRATIAMPGCVSWRIG